MCDLTRGITRA
jgi:putative ABC transport system substrate-binding protein